MKLDCRHGCTGGCAWFVAGVLVVLLPAGCAIQGNGGGGGGGVVCVTLPSSITTDTTLTPGCYIAEDDISVSGGANLTIEAGVTIEFAPETEISVYDDGSLHAIGTADDPILLTGVEKTRGSWGGLRFYESNSVENELAYVTIEYGGGYWDANVTLNGSSSAPARVRISSCDLQLSATYGFQFNAYSILDDFSENRITENTLGAGRVTARAVGNLKENNSYSGNDIDVVVIEGGTVDTDQTWPGIDAYYLTDGSIAVSALLTIAPGARLVFASGEEMTVWDDGQLAAVGTQADPVVLTGQESIRGYWGGLRFYQSNSLANRLQYVTIEYGGGYWDANLYLVGAPDSPARVDIADCTLRESGAFGFDLNAYAVVPEFVGNTVTANTSGAGKVHPDVVGYLDDGSLYTGNDVDIVQIEDGTVSADQAWPGIDARYRMNGSLAVSAFLTIEAGATFEFNSGEEMTVWDDGRLNAAGTAESPILFTGVEQTPGYWGGLRFYQSNSSDNRLEWVTIEYGGGYWEADLDLRGAFDSPATVEAVNCTFRGSGVWGAYLSRYSAVNADFETANSFTDNAEGDVFREP